MNASAILRAMQTAITSMADAQKLAARQHRVDAEVELQSLSRLNGLLVAPFGRVKYRLSFAPDVVGRACVTVQLHGQARLLCQRSLEPFDFVIDSTSKLGFIAEEAEEASLMEGFDPILLGYTPVSFESIAEDELILLIPPVPVNPAVVAQSDQHDGPAGVWEAKAPEQAHPFAQLGELLKSNKRN
jgi:uncharacterized protein